MKFTLVLVTIALLGGLFNALCVEWLGPEGYLIGIPVCFMVGLGYGWYADRMGIL